VHPHEHEGDGNRGQVERMTMYLLLAAVGLFVGTIGTLIGAGGGFLLMPLLVLLYPTERPEVLASISLAVVFLNATSGSIAYARQRNIDYKSSAVFIATGIPGAIGGALVTSAIPRSAFDLWLGGLLILVAAAMLVLGTIRPPKAAEDARASVPNARGKGGVLSFFVGFVSSLLGIGGGIVHVPGMVYLLRFPVHLAAGTSHFVLAFTAAAGTIAHLANGEFHSGFRRSGVLAAGAIVGAQLGARLSKAAPPSGILRLLALALGAVGVRVVFQAINAISP
jgi:uncharacterized membrane protein YfcA